MTTNGKALISEMVFAHFGDQIGEMGLDAMKESIMRAVTELNAVERELEEILAALNIQAGDRYERDHGRRSKVAC